MNPASSLDQGRRVTTSSESVTTGLAASAWRTSTEDSLIARLDERISRLTLTLTDPDAGRYADILTHGAPPDHLGSGRAWRAPVCGLVLDARQLVAPAC